MPQSAPQTCTIPVRELRRVLRVVLPHLSKDDTLPLLTDVEVTLDGHTLTVAATDRFTLAAANATVMTSAPVIDWTNTVPGAHLSTLARMLPRTKRSADLAVTLTVTDARLSVKIPDSDLCDDPEWHIPTTGREFIKWRPLVNKALIAQRGAKDVFLNPALLARWTRLATGMEPIRVLITSEREPIVLLTKGAVGLQMPYRATHLGQFGRELVDPWRALSAA